MGLFAKLFGKKPAPGGLTVADLPPHIAEALVHPPRLVNEGPEFPRGPVVLARAVTSTQIEEALTRAGFARADQAWTRGETEVQHRSENGATLLEVSGDPGNDAMRELLATLPWVDPTNGFYDAMKHPSTLVEDLRYLVCALRHYKCVGGVPMEMRRHSDPEIQETVRLIERDQMAAAARAQRSKKR